MSIARVTEESWHSLAVAVIATVYFHVTAFPAALSSDATRDFLFARDCVELARCHGIGAKTSLLGLYQGGLWPAVIALVELGGGTAVAVQSLVVALQGLAVGTLHRAVTLLGARGAALSCAVAFAMFLTATGDCFTLWNPSLLALPTVLAGWAFAAHATARKDRYAAAAAVAVAVTAEAHVGVGLGLVPGLIATTLAFSRRPALALAAVSFLAPAVFAIVSSDAIAGSVYEVSQKGGGRVALAAVAVSISVGVALRRPMSRATVAWRRTAGAVAFAGPAFFGQLWLLATGRTDIELRYLYGVAAVISLATGLVAERSVNVFLARWAVAPRLSSPLSALLVLSLLVPWHRRQHVRSTNWTFADLVVVAKEVEGRSFEDAKRSLQGGGCPDLSAGLAVVTPRASTNAGSTDDALLALKLDGQVSVPDGSNARVFAARGGGTLFLRRFTSSLARERSEVCVDPIEPRGDPRCTSLGVVPTDRASPGEFLYEPRANDEAYELRGEKRYVVRVTIPVRTGAREAPDVLLVERDTPCPWTLASTATSIVFTRTIEAGCGFDRRAPPCFVESRPDERWIRELATRAR